MEENNLYGPEKRVVKYTLLFLGINSKKINNLLKKVSEIRNNKAKYINNRVNMIKNYENFITNYKNFITKKEYNPNNINNRNKLNNLVKKLKKVYERYPGNINREDFTKKIARLLGVNRIHIPRDIGRKTPEKDTNGIEPMYGIEEPVTSTFAPAPAPAPAPAFAPAPAPAPAPAFAPASAFEPSTPKRFSSNRRPVSFDVSTPIQKSPRGMKRPRSATNSPTNSPTNSATNSPTNSPTSSPTNPPFKRVAYN